MKEGPIIEKKHLLYMNFTIATATEERSHVYKLFDKKSFCFKGYHQTFTSYANDLAASKFVLSPRGSGLDCFRTWEALYAGSFPIVKTSSLDPLYEGLPVVIINNWEEVTEDFLNEKYEKLTHKSFSLEKLSKDYWTKLIRSF
jgi:hypothetical protein